MNEHRISILLLIVSGMTFGLVSLVVLQSKKSSLICNMKPIDFVNKIDFLGNAINQETLNKRFSELSDEQELCFKAYLNARVEEEQERAKIESHASAVASPAAQAAIKTFGVNPDNITSVSWMKPGGDLEWIGPIETIHVRGGPDYYYMPEKGKILDSPPEGLPEGYIVDREETSP